MSPPLVATDGSENPRLAAALWLASLGWPVFPVHEPILSGDGSPPTCSCGAAGCKNIGKHPRTMHGFKDATTSKPQIRAWWEKWPNANIGVPTGADFGRLVLDVDPRHGGHESLAGFEAMHGKLPQTVLALTGGGGQHHVFAHPGGYIKSRTIAPGLDIKAEGGYIVVEPSLHWSGNHYVWELSSRPGEVSLAAAPQWLIHLCGKTDKPPLGTSPNQRGIRDGVRNTTLTSMAGAMRRRAMSEGSILAALRAENSNCCAPALPDDEVSAIARSIARYDPECGPPAWEPPLALHKYARPAPFPIDAAFPLELAGVRDYVKALAEELQVPVEVPAMLLMAIISATLLKKFEIEARENWRECPPIWVLVLLDSGDRKSAVFRRLTDPLMEWEREQGIKLAPDIATAREQREILERQRRFARRQAGEGDDEAAERARELAAELAKQKEVHPPGLVSTDATSEALIQLMQGNGERALIASPEADALDVLLGRYDEKARPNMGIWLKAYTGDRVRVHRTGRDPVFLDKPLLSVALTVQPEAVRGMYSNRMARGRGLLARFFVSMPQSLVGYRRIVTKPVPEVLHMTFVTTVRHLLEVELQAEMGPRIVRLSAEASAMFTEFQSRIELELRDGRTLGDRRDWGAKLCGGVLRLALAMHCMVTHGQAFPPAGLVQLEVSAATMAAALAWVPYLMEHERAATDLVGCDPDTAIARILLGWLRRSGVERFSKREAFDACRGRSVQHAEDVDCALRRLEEHGHVWREPTPPPAGKGGRPASPAFLVNPLWDRGGDQ
jgi:hypothetical protein